ncbi:putative RNA methylase [Trachipleistophora hominis]|uniref:Methyltransferase-like protein 5 n=1 Tax=Trachipleistophora hominis TaxID=72359 RepID=L7JXS0_TRAHO|nr:putative RNA methylase [Trachipleistophora hominis]
MDVQLLDHAISYLDYIVKLKFWAKIILILTSLAMKLKDVKSRLSQLKPFKTPKIKYEQYITPPSLSATTIHMIETVYNDIHGKSVLDLCGGTGMLGITCAFYDPLSVVNVDIDRDALEICRTNMLMVDKHVDLINCDFQNLRLNTKFDTCVMNPPFGMKCKGSDVLAIESALRCSNVVYVLHSTKTREYYLNKFDNIEVIAETKYDLPSSYLFHKKKNKVIDVDLYRIANC